MPYRPRPSEIHVIKQRMTSAIADRSGRSVAWNAIDHPMMMAGRRCGFAYVIADFGFGLCSERGMRDIFECAYLASACDKHRKNDKSRWADRLDDGQFIFDRLFYVVFRERVTRRDLSFAGSVLFVSHQLKDQESLTRNARFLISGIR